jgi:hypothetical protein
MSKAVASPQADGDGRHRRRFDEQGSVARGRRALARRRWRHRLLRDARFGRTDTTDTAGPDQPDTARTNEPATPDPGAVADRLERALKRERLWSTVSIEGTRVDVRSGSCADPQLAGIVDASAAALKAAGLTRVRCLEQSGRVVTDRDL